jgi:predicted ester cyclase
MTRLTATGTQEGELLGMPPSHRKVTSTVIVVHRLRGGKIAEARIFWDALAFLRETGALEGLRPATGGV